MSNPVYERQVLENGTLIESRVDVDAPEAPPTAPGDPEPVRAAPASDLVAAVTHEDPWRPASDAKPEGRNFDRFGTHVGTPPAR